MTSVSTISGKSEESSSSDCTNNKTTFAKKDCALVGIDLSVIDDLKLTETNSTHPLDESNDDFDSSIIRPTHEYVRSLGDRLDFIENYLDEKDIDFM